LKASATGAKRWAHSLPHLLQVEAVRDAQAERAQRQGDAQSGASGLQADQLQAGAAQVADYAGGVGRARQHAQGGVAGLFLARQHAGGEAGLGLDLA
jgi:hypothetical protein